MDERAKHLETLAKECFKNSNSEQYLFFAISAEMYKALGLTNSVQNGAYVAMLKLEEMREKGEII